MMFGNLSVAELLSEDDVHPVAGHISVSFDRLVIIWGGYYENDGGTVIYNHSQHLLVYDTEIKRWFRFVTSGPYPTGNSGCCGVLVDYTLYVFGGYFDSEDDGSDLRALNLKTLTWTTIQPSTNVYPTPRHKFAGWEYQNKLYFFGGFGPPPSSLIANKYGREYLDENAKFVVDHHSSFVGLHTWNDQLVCFDLKRKCWESVLCKGDIPSARAAHSAVKINNNRVVLFGGRHGEKRLNDIYVLHLKNFSWTRIMTDLLPIGRSWHTMSLVDERYLILFGGFSQERVPLNDLWFFDTYSMQFFKLKRDTEDQQRIWHTSVVVKNSLYVFGGCKSDILANVGLRRFTNEMFVVDFSPKSLLRLCVDFCLKSSKASKQKLLIAMFPKPVASKLNVELGHVVRKVRTPFELLSI